MTPRTTKTNNALRRAGLDAVAGWAVLGSLGFHAALVSGAVALAAFGAHKFIPGEARAPAGLSVPVVSSAPLETPTPPTTTPPTAPIPAPPAPAGAATESAVLAPAALTDAREIPTTFAAPIVAPLVQADTPPETSAMRSTPTVFGVSGEREAQRVIYLIDASGSMVAALPVVLGEVARSIDALAPSQRFNVGVFSAGGVHAPSNLASGRDGLIPATESNKNAIRRWLRALDASGNGDALDALRWGLQQRPDIVFLMAKGITDRGQTAEQREASALRFLDEVERLNPKDPSNGLRPVRIRTIEFFDPDASHLLERLGEEHGEFGDAAPSSGHRFISRRELGLE